MTPWPTRAFRTALWIILPSIIAVWLFLGVQICEAATLEVGKPSALTSRAVATQFVASEEQATMVYLNCHNSVNGTLFVHFTVEVELVTIGTVEWKNEASGNVQHTFSFIVPAKAKWEYLATNVTCNSSYQELKATVTAGPEGKEGKEGKPGAEGKEGPKGEAGAAGPSSKDEITSFGPTAEGTISEALEHVEALFFAIIGTMLAMAVAMMAYKLTHS